MMDIQISTHLDELVKLLEDVIWEYHNLSQRRHSGNTGVVISGEVKREGLTEHAGIYGNLMNMCSVLVLRFNEVTCRHPDLSRYLISAAFANFNEKAQDQRLHGLHFEEKFYMEEHIQRRLVRITFTPISPNFGLITYTGREGQPAAPSPYKDTLRFCYAK